MNSPTGILVSQVGYDEGYPIRAFARGPEDWLSPDATFTVTADDGTTPMRGPVAHWGQIWGSHWWTCDVSGLPTGRYTLSIEGHGALASDPFDVGANLLWERTVELTGIDQLERRQWLAKQHTGWCDCGGGWQEANSHTATVIGLCDLRESGGPWLSPRDLQRLEAQIMNGCEYLCLLQDCAEERGHPSGCLSHQIFLYEDVVLPQDADQAVVAWMRAANVLGEAGDARRADYIARATRAAAWIEGAAPLAPVNVSKTNHGIAAALTVPKEWMTRDLLMRLWGAMLLAGRDNPVPSDRILRLVDRILARQIGRQQESGLYGHFRIFDSLDTTEKAWVHNLDGGEFGGDAAGHFPHYILPLIQLARRYPTHPDAPRWRSAVHNFAYGYFLPACRANPFSLLPLGDFGDEALLWFAGLWHGMNGAYALAAKLAIEFSRFFDDDAFIPIAVGNLQWIAGLNSGLTAESLSASRLYSTSLPPGRAVPHSMISGVGNRSSGGFFGLRGSICNGFSTGNQFEFDVEPTAANDGPFTFTDEDWITHAGAWVSAVATLRAMTRS